MDRIRVGTVAYVNARPLTDTLNRARFELVEAVPSLIAQQLVDGEVDVGLVPVKVVLDHPELRIVPGWCVGADGPVHSVVIAAETEPEAWTEVVLDGSSRTSVTLARLLLAEGPLKDRVRADLVLTDGAPGDGPKRVGGTVAAVVIGDPARELDPSLRRWDLSALWKDWTGRPFVFAVWAAREGLSQAVRDALWAAGEQGVASIPERYTGDDLHYLTTYLRHRLDEPALIGLREFAARAHRAGLVASHLVALLDPAVRRRDREDVDAYLDAAVRGEAPDRAGLALLAEAVSGADLQLAGLMVKEARHGASRGTYLLSHGVDAAVAAAGGEAWAASVEAARQAQADTIALSGVDGLRPDEIIAAVRAVTEAGLSPSLLPMPGGVDPAALSAAGLRVAAVDAHRLTAPLLSALQQASLAVEAHLWLDRDDALDVLVRLQALSSGGGLSAVHVHLALPKGALVAVDRPTPATYLRGVALTRLALPEVAHVVASPLTQDLVLAQAAWLAGADDLGPIGIGADPRALPEGVARFEVAVGEAERALRALGLEPVRRDPSWHEVGGALTAARRVRPVDERDRSAVHVREV